MNSDQLDFICKNVPTTPSWEWFHILYKKTWLGGKIRWRLASSIELCKLQVIDRKDLQTWKDYETAKQLGRNRKEEQGKGGEAKERT